MEAKFEQTYVFSKLFSRNKVLNHRSGWTLCEIFTTVMQTAVAKIYTYFFKKGRSWDFKVSKKFPISPVEQHMLKEEL